jgi:mannitol operon transcriptional antiterminator
VLQLTTRQRDLLYVLLDNTRPVSTTELAAQLGFTPRQVSYDLYSIEAWLSRHSIGVLRIPGVGIKLNYSNEERDSVIDLLNSNKHFQLIINADQRQQLIAFHLLTETEPIILQHIQYETDVSRTTVLNDLETINEWFHRFGLTLNKRPNYGNVCAGPELARRQALAALLWGDPSFSHPLITITRDRGFVFALSQDAHLLPIVRYVKDMLENWDILSAYQWMELIVKSFGGRLSAEAERHVAMMLAIQAERVESGQRVALGDESLHWTMNQPIWEAATRLAEMIWPDMPVELLREEIAVIVLYLLGSTRHTTWTGDHLVDAGLMELVQSLTDEAATQLTIPDLGKDEQFQNGLIAHLVPLWIRHNFSLWFPPATSMAQLSSQFKAEYAIAEKLAAQISASADMTLPESEINNLALLLRAAVIRTPPSHQYRAYVICPSGMATVQLLVARLKARFAHLEIVDALSLHELSSANLDDVHLIITTVPLPANINRVKQILVNPMLPPEDVETVRNALLAIE